MNEETQVTDEAAQALIDAPALTVEERLSAVELENAELKRRIDLISDRYFAGAV